MLSCFALCLWGCVRMSFVVIDYDGVCFASVGSPSPTHVAHNLMECRTLLLLPSWRVAWAGGASRMGTRKVQGQHRD